MYLIYDRSVGEGMCVGVGGVCVGDWVGDGMVVWGGGYTLKG